MLVGEGRAVVCVGDPAFPVVFPSQGAAEQSRAVVCVGWEGLTGS